MSALQTHRSSGDLLADRRYAYAAAAFAEHDFEATYDLAKQSLELAPLFGPSHALLGRAAAALGNKEEAISAFYHALNLDPDDELGVRIDLARLGEGEPRQAIGPAYVKALFDQYAPRFDAHLVGALGYRAPELIREALDALQRKPFLRAIDLGCGTGLMAQALCGAVADMIGVDLSAQMLREAERTGFYSALFEENLTDFLRGRPSASADLVVAADVFVYMADLSCVFAQVKRVLSRDGVFIFTVQTHPGKSFVLGRDARYAHAPSLVLDLLQEAGFCEPSFMHVSTRMDEGLPVPGGLVVAFP